MSGVAFEGWGGGGAAIPNPLPVARGGTGAQDVAGILATLGLAGALPVNADLVRRFGVPLLEGGWAPALWGSAPGFAPGAAVTRPSAATAFVDGALAEFVAGAPRWADWTDRSNGARALLVGGQRTNAVPNPRAEGLVPGSPGTLPTGWANPTSQTGLTRTLSAAAFGTATGIGIRLAGTATNTGTTFVEFTTRVAAPAAASGQRRAGALWLRLASGSTAGVAAILLRYFALTSGGSPLTAVQSANLVGQLDGTWRLFQLPATLPVDATTGRAVLGLGTQFTNGATGDIALEAALPQDEPDCGFASSPILPPPGTLAAATRLADALPALPVSGPATVLIEAALPSLPTASDGNMLLAQFDGGTDADRLRVHLQGGGTSLVAGRVVGGAPADAMPLGAVAAGTRFALALRHDGAGTLGAAMTGGAVQTLGGGLAGVTALLLGNNRAGVSPLFGLVRQARLFGRALSDAELLAAVA